MKKNRKLLVSSFIMVLTCCILFTATTFAWFSDSVTSNNNIITAGNLDVELHYSTDGTNWAPVTPETFVFDQEALWEPGHTESVLLKVVNAGSLALKYSLSLDVTSEVSSVNVNGDEFKVSDYLEVGSLVSETLDASVINDRDAAMKLAATKVGFGAINTSATLLSGETDFVQLAISMPTTVGNEANHRKDAKVPSVTFGLNLTATQVNYEEDSLGSNYDENSPWVGGLNTSWYNTTDSTFTLSTAEELAGLASIVNSGKDTFKNKTVSLDKDIDLNNFEWSPIGSDEDHMFAGKFDGNGHTVSNLKVNKLSESYVGLFGYVEGGNLANVNVCNVKLAGLSHVGSIAGQIFTGEVSNCHVTGTVSIYVEYAYAGGIVGGDYVNITDCSVVATDMGEIKVNEKTGAGGICGWHTEGNYLLQNCVVKNLNITAWGNVGGVTGFVHYQNVMENCSVENVNLTKTRVDGHPSIGVYAGGWSYNASHNVTIKNSSAKDVTLSGNYVAVSSANILYGSEYSGKLTSNVVLENTNEENITNNLVEVSKATTNAQLDSAIKAGQDTLVLTDGNYIIPDSAQGKTLHIVGLGENTVIGTQDDGSYEGCDYSLDGSTVVFENITINTNSATYTGYARLNATYINCTINGTYTLYGDSTFINCTFNIEGDKYNIWTWGAPTATFENCTFNSDGKALLLYGQAQTKLTLKNCTFNDNGGLDDLKAAIEIGNDYNTSYTVVVENTVVNGYEVNDKGINTGTTLWGNKNSMSPENLSVTVDGVKVY